jgi:mono/diheme cytochrome c family protein
MRMLQAVAAGALVVWSALAASVVAGDARRGEQLFKSQQCILCHSFNGEVGGTAAPDLSTHINRDYTPAVMASLMWNHAPDMWEGMKKRGIVKAELSQESAADLFAYIWARQYMLGHGNAERGQKAFAEKNCAECHNHPPSVNSVPLDASMEGTNCAECHSDARGAPKLARGMDAYSDITLVAALWERGSSMLDLMNQKKLAWPRFTEQQMSDLIAYVNSL